MGEVIPERDLCLDLPLEEPLGLSEAWGASELPVTSALSAAAGLAVASGLSLSEMMGSSKTGRLEEDAIGADIFQKFAGRRQWLKCGGKVGCETRYLI